MENKQMDKRHQRTDDKSNQKTTNGFKNSPKGQQQPNADAHRSKTGSDWNSTNQPRESGRSGQDKPESEGYQNQHSEKGSSENRPDHQSRNQQTQKNQTGKDQGKWEGQDMNHRTEDKPSHSSPKGQYNPNPNRNRDTESAGVLDEDRSLFQDEEMDQPTRKTSYSESNDTENSNINSPTKKNQAPPSKFS